MPSAFWQGAQIVLAAAFSETADLSNAERAAMRALLDRHFLGVTVASFETDLADKTHALRLRRGGTLVGFSTLAFYEHGGRPVVCSGDTVVDPSAWGSPDLARHWIGAVRSLAPEAFQAAGIDWLLLTGGFRTYRLLSTFWQRFVPHPTDADPRLLARRDELAAHRWGDRFDAATGVVRLAHPTPMRPHLAGVPEGRAVDPAVACFTRHNPGHAAGDELACLAELTDENLTRAGRRMLR